ncbi:TPA: RHS repeat-associated core domain-containing protein [Escherichia coli]|nr:RHS repeat protein [Escherichia coli]HCB8738620.1 RHS repeat protein [Escherichia coli]HCP1293969.1 RHS repeat protein [Escherichia coli]
MSGKPAARQGDMTRKGLDIVQGSAGVLIGAPTGVACSVCPKKKDSPNYGNPVNPVLGAKVLPGETDIALPGPLPFILSRAYSSYRTRTPAPVGVFGPGWKAPFDIRLQIRDEGLILNDSGGRSIHFEPLFPGEISYSRSESLWLARGGVAAQHSSQPLSALWQVLPEDVRLSPHVYLATNSLQGPWWILSWPERVPGADEVLPPPPPAYRVLTRVVDGFGRTLAFHRAAKGDVAGAVTGVTDGAGRRFHLALTTQAQRAEAFRKQRASSLSSPASPRSVSSSQVFPDTLPAGTEYGADNGIRLEAVWLTHDPAYPDEQPTAPLARYTYTAGGELRAVYDRSGTQVRGFAYDAEHAGRMVAHHYAGRPESRYRYDDTGRVTEQVNPEGLEETWYGWDGDRLTTVQTQQTRIQTVYQPGSFTPLLRIETENGEQAKARHRSLAEVLQEDTGVTLPAELAVMLGRLERELRAGAVSAESEAWLAQCGLTVEQMESQMEAEYIPERRLHLYHCDHRGLPQALISPEGETAWRGEYDEWGNQLNEENPPHLYQPYRLPGQQYDEESGLYYNRHRYYDPLQGRYITQDPIGLKGGINLYTYPLAPIRYTDPLGLERVISVYGPPAPDRAGAETPLVLTDMTGGVTIYYDPETGDSMTFDCSNRIDRRSQRGAGDPYTGEVVGCETNGSGISAAYGTTKIYTTDTRARWLHGGGSSLRDPYAPRQGWKPTMGCTRAQNEDVDELCKKVTSWMYSHPGERIRYERFKTR